MKTEFKVLLYLKRNGQGKDGLCPLMGRIMIKATGNSTTQFGCKIRVDPKLWNATSQRCTGKSRMAIATNRAIDKMMLLLKGDTANWRKSAMTSPPHRYVTLSRVWRRNR